MSGFPLFCRIDRPWSHEDGEPDAPGKASSSRPYQSYKPWQPRGNNTKKDLSTLPKHFFSKKNLIEGYTSVYEKLDMMMENKIDIQVEIHFFYKIFILKQGGSLEQGGCIIAWDWIIRCPLNPPMHADMHVGGSIAGYSIHPHALQLLITNNVEWWCVATNHRPHHI